MLPNHRTCEAGLPPLQANYLGGPVESDDGYSRARPAVAAAEAVVDSAEVLEAEVRTVGEATKAAEIVEAARVVMEVVTMAVVTMARVAMTVAVAMVEGNKEVAKVAEVGEVEEAKAVI